MKVIKIFFASSEELLDDRNAFGNMVRRLNKSYEKRGVHLDLFEWEDYDASFAGSRKQEEYNEFVRESDIFLAVFHTHAGKFTLEEFEVALEEFEKRNLPKIYIYCKDLKEGETEQADLKDFKERLRNDMGHYWSRYSNRDSMQLHFIMQLQIAEQDVYSPLKVEQGNVVFEGQLVAKLENLPFAALNEDYIRMNSRLSELPAIIEKTRLRIAKYPDDEEFQEQLEQQQKEYDSLKEKFEEHQNNLLATARRVVQLQGDRVTARMRRAMDALSEGKVKEANIILDEAEKDGELALNDYNESLKTAELKRQNVISSIEEIRLKISALTSDLSIPVEKRVPMVQKLFVLVDEMSQAVDYEAVKYMDFLDTYASFLSYHALYNDELSKLFRALEISKKHYGEEHDSVSLLYNRIGIAFNNIGEKATAVQYFSRALTIEENNHREDKQANLYNSMAQVYHSLGDQNNAMACLMKGLELGKKIYGPYHVYVARLYQTMSQMCLDFKMYEEAVEFSKSSIDIYEQYYGEESMECATLYNNHAILLEFSDRKEEALEWLQKSCALREKFLGGNHPDTANSYNNLASIHISLGNYEEALGYALKDYEFAQNSQESRRSGHYAMSLYHLASIYYNLVHMDEALVYYLMLMSEYEKNPGTAVSELVRTANSIGFICYKLKDYDKALEYYLKALEISRESNYNDMDTLSYVYDNIGQLYYVTARYEEALEYFSDALEYRKAAVGKNSPELAVIYNNLGCSYEALGQYEKALENHLRAAELREEAFGQDNDATVLSYSNVSFMYKFIGQYEPALEYALKVLDIRTRMKGKLSHDCLKSYRHIASIYDLAGRNEEAQDASAEAAEIAKALYGEDAEQYLK